MESKSRVWIDRIPKSIDKPHQVLSYGAGKQTFYMLVAIEQGLLPKPELVIFSDTQGEKEDTYWHIENVAKPLCAKMGLEYVTISKGNLKEDVGRRFQTPKPPLCSLDYKARPIQVYLFKRFGLKRGVHQVDVWIGITTEEAHRNTPTSIAYCRKVFPLLDLGLSRQDCIDKTIEAGYPVPVKSGCDFCPYENWEKVFQEDKERFYRVKPMEDLARERYPKVRLPMYQRSLAAIEANPKPKALHDEESCVVGNCTV